MFARFGIHLFVLFLTLQTSATQAQSQNGNEVARRLGVIADNLADEASNASTLARNIESSSPANVPRLVQAEARDSSKRLSQNVINELWAGFQKEPAQLAPTELGIHQRVLTFSLDRASMRAEAYAAYLRRVQQELAPLSERAALEKLQTVYVPPDVLVVLEEQDSERGVQPPPSPNQKPIAPFVISPDGGFTVDYPSVGAIMHLNNDDVLQAGCTGTLIAPNLVLTAAHCTLRQINAVYFPHAGVFSLASEPIVHPDFVPDLSRLPDADLAILVLAKAVVGIKPVKINDALSVVGGVEGRIVGYGARRYYSDQSSPSAGMALSLDEVLAASGLKIRAKVKTSACAGGHTARAICWRFENKKGAKEYGTTCKGDSGGPLFVSVGGDTLLFGVTSGGDPDKPCAQNSQAFDVNVEKFATWIKTTIAAHAVLGQVMTDSLEPAVNGRARFMHVGEYDHFTANRLVWDGAVNVPDGLATMRIAVNTTLRGVKVGIEVSSEQNPSRNHVCQPIGLGNIAYCEIALPAKGRWTVRASSDTEKEFQAVITAFKHLP